MRGLLTYNAFSLGRRLIINKDKFILSALKAWFEKLICWKHKLFIQQTPVACGTRASFKVHKYTKYIRYFISLSYFQLFKVRLFKFLVCVIKRYVQAFHIFLRWELEHGIDHNRFAN
jgi:hypothetical protein